MKSISRPQADLPKVSTTPASLGSQQPTNPAPEDLFSEPSDKHHFEKSTQLDSTHWHDFSGNYATSIASSPVLNAEQADAIRSAQEKAALTHVQPNGGVESVNETATVHAAWSARAKEMASHALAKTSGLTGNAAIAAAVDSLLTMPEAKDARISLCIQDLAPSGSAIKSHQPHLPLNPASNSKLATASFALGVLGPDYVFETSIKQDNTGNLYVVGGFDPSLSAQDLLHMAQQLKAKGFEQIQGDLVLDNSRLVGDRNPAHFEEFGDQDWDYLARPEALSVDKNLVQIEVLPNSQPGLPAQLKASQSAFQLLCNVTTREAGQPFKIGCDEQDVAGVLVRNSNNQAIIDVWGDIAADYNKGKKLVMKSPDPNASFGDRMAWALREAGIQFTGNIRSGETPNDATTLHTHQSKPLGELVKVSVATSNAFDHEMYSLAAASALSPDGKTSIFGAMNQLNHFLEKELHLSDFHMNNASGIGEANLLSGQNMVDLLRNAKANPRYSVLLDSLAQPGERGTLRTRMLNTPAEGRLHAKTGTLKSSVALSGYVRTDQGAERAFSCLINDYKQGRSGARATLDALGIILSSVS